VKAILLLFWFSMPLVLQGQSTQASIDPPFKSVVGAFFHRGVARELPRPFEYRDFWRRLMIPGNGLRDIYRVEIEQLGVPNPAANGKS
jgi:hypothetical protein